MDSNSNSNKKLVVSIAVVTGALLAAAGIYKFITSNENENANRKQQKNEPSIIFGDASDGCSNQINVNMHQFLQHCKQINGDIFTLRMNNNKYTTFIMDTTMLKKAIYNKSADFITVSKTSKLRFGLTEITQLKNGISLLSKCFHNSLSSYENLNNLTKSAQNTVNIILKELINSNCNNEWKYESKPLNEWIVNLVMKIELNVLFGPLFDNDKELIDLYFKFEEYIPLRLNGKQKIVMNNIMNQLMNKVETLINKYDIYTVPPAIKMVNDFCEKYNLNKTRNRLIIAMLWATLSNTSHTMSWVVYHILNDKKCEQRIANELDTIDINFDFNRTNVKALLPTLHSLINEVFRYYAQSNIIRYLLNDIIINDPYNKNKTYKLRKGDWIAGCCSFLHRNHKYFTNPNEFKFDRFVGSDKIDKKNLFTFGTHCEGRYFAQNLILILSALLLKQFEMKIVDKNGKELHNNFNIPPIGFVGAFGIPKLNENFDFHFKWRIKTKD